MTAKKRTTPQRLEQPGKLKPKYRIKNWSRYNPALVRRGSLTIWVDARVLRARAARAVSGKVGRPFTYSDRLVSLLVVLQEVYHLPLRQAEGFARSVLRLLKVGRRQVPSYSTLCRRRQKLRVALPQRHRAEPLHIVVDSTGLKIYGEGEWKVRQHGYSQRRTWRRLHLAIDEASGEVTASVLTAEGRSDHDTFPQLLDRTRARHAIRQVSGDTAYDYYAVYRYLAKHVPRARVTMAPRINAVLVPADEDLAERDRNVAAMRAVGRRQWKLTSGYSRRSLAETAVFRYKTIFGASLSARREDSQRVQALARCRALNQMTRLGMPESYRVVAA